MLSRALAAASPSRRTAQGRSPSPEPAAPADRAAALDLGHGHRRPFSLPALPYAENALLPVISPRTVHFHYHRHHAGYVATLNQLLVGHPLSAESLETIIRDSAGSSARAGLFNDAAQVWNHSFYWRSLTPGGGGRPSGHVAAAIERNFGSFNAFRERLITAATGQFGSGWAWLCAEGDRLTVRRTGNAETPIQVPGITPLLTIDVWEHAYYIDYQNRRADHVALVVDRLLNWSFANRNLDDHLRQHGRPAAETGERVINPVRTVASAAAIPAVPAQPPSRMPETRAASFSRLARRT
jgi:Fe-Mn family superoxide dismutase